MMIPREQSVGRATAFATPEMQVLFCCARREMRCETREQLRALLSADLDWSLLATLAEQHKMMPLLWRHLEQHADSLPSSAVEPLRRSFLENAHRMLLLSGELRQLSELLARQGIIMVPYKGPVLGAQLYGNLALRQAGDLDLLVRRGDVERARAVLLDRGYRPRHTLSRGAEKFMVHSRYSEEFERPNGPNVELHWAFTNGDVALRLDLDDLAPRLESFKLGGGVVSVVAREDLLIILCLHGSKHRWDRLEWLCGLAELLRASAGDLDWDAVVARASALGARRMLLLGVLLARELLDAPVPRHVYLRARADRTVARLADEVPSVLCTFPPKPGRESGDLSTDLFRFRLRERTRDRWRFIWYRLTTPSRPESWAAISLGAYWMPVHGLTRPFGVLRKLLPALRRYRLRTR